MAFATRREVSVSKYKAVIFDLWGTLVDDVVHPEANRLAYQQMTDKLANWLGVDRGEFSKAWDASGAKRTIGGFPSTEAALSHICRGLGVDPGEERIHAVAEMRYEYVRDALTPRPGAVKTLSTLKDSGYRVGLISNCSEEVSRLWDSTPFAPLVNVALLSFNVGLAKPDLRIYELATKRLGVAAEHCLFVGDGGGGELTGASKAGMTAVLIRAPYDQADGARESWEGETISDIRDVLGLVS